MKKFKLNSFSLVAVLMLLAAFCMFVGGLTIHADPASLSNTVAVATDTGAATGTTTTTTTSALPGNAKWAQGAIAIAVPIVLAAIKIGIPFLPGWLVPILAGVLGGVGDLIMHIYGVGTPGQGVIAGLAGTGLREVVDQLKQQAKAQEKS